MPPTSVNVTLTDSTLLVRAPWVPGFPERAHELNGRFASSRWIFDRRDEARVCALLREMYGTDGSETSSPLVTVQVTLSELEGFDGRSQSCWFASRRIVHRPGRDAPVIFGNGVVLISPTSFPWSGGSVANPRLIVPDDCVLEVRDIPAGHPDLSLTGVRLLTGPDRSALVAERETLLARLAEIERVLSTE